MKINTFCHIEIPAPDLVKAKDFYEKIFLWEVTILPDKSYAFYDDGLIGGGFDPTMPACSEGVNLVIEVENINKKLEEIKTAGGSIIREKTRISDEHGYYASFLDPNGVRLSIWCED